MGSKLIRELLELNPDSGDAIPLAAVEDRELILILEYLKSNLTEPIKRINRVRLHCWHDRHDSDE